MWTSHFVEQEGHMCIYLGIYTVVNSALLNSFIKLT